MGNKKRTATSLAFGPFTKMSMYACVPKVTGEY